MMDVQQTTNSQAFPTVYPIELHPLYEQLSATLQLLYKRESDRSDSINYEEELNQLKIRIDYPIQFERVNTFNTIIIRHAFSLHNFFKRTSNFDDRRIYHSDLIDPPLHYFGKKQCEYLKQYVHNMDFSVVLISPLQRTVQTAQLLFNDHPNKKNIKFILVPLATEKISSQYSFFRWGRLAAIKEEQEKNPDMIQMDFSAFENFKNKELWQLELVGNSKNNFQGRTIQEQQERFLLEEFVKHGKRIALESEEQCFRRGLRLKEFLKDLANSNNGTSLKVCLISHSVLIKTFFAKGLDDNKNIIKDPSFYLENGNLTAVNF